jgi:endonuclease G, mitochondrial
MMAIELDDDRELDASLREQASEAARRWKERAPIRDAKAKAVVDGRALDADSPPRVASRLNRLIDEVRKSTQRGRAPDNPVLNELMQRSTPLAAEDLNEELVQEVVNGVRNFLSVEFLSRGVQESRRVGRILIDTGGRLKARGTGFLVGRGIVMTNHHVLKTREQAATCFIQMDYEQNRFSPNPQPQLFAFEPDRLFINDKALDYALVAVAPKSNQGALIEQYGWLALDKSLGKITVNPDDYVNIIQHPLGREKEIVVRDNRILDLATSNQDGAAIGPFLHYEADTEKGSSGSPVVNDQWEVVALHHTGVPKEDANGRWLDKEGKVWDERTQAVSEIDWQANEGVRVSALMAALAQVQVSAKEKALLDLVTANVPFSPGPAPKADPRPETVGESSEVPDVRRRPPDAGPSTNPPSPPKDLRTSAEIEIPLKIALTFGEPRAAGVVGAFVKMPIPVHPRAPGFCRRSWSQKNTRTAMVMTGASSVSTSRSRL